MTQISSERIASIEARKHELAEAMARADLRDRDPLCVPISLVTPHYQFWRTWFSGR